MLVIDRKYHVTLSERSAVLSVSSMSYSESVVTHTEYEYKNKNEYDKWESIERKERLVLVDFIDSEEKQLYERVWW